MGCSEVFARSHRHRAAFAMGSLAPAPGFGSAAPRRIFLSNWAGAHAGGPVQLAASVRSWVPWPTRRVGKPAWGPRPGGGRARRTTRKS